MGMQSPMLDVTSFFAATDIDYLIKGWVLPVVTLAILAVTALVDARTGRVPDAPILGGLVFVTALYGFTTDWPTAARHLEVGLGAMLGLYLLNQLYYRCRQRDALGMGDAKWTALAAATFGLPPVLYGWVFGAWLALLWMGLRHLLRRKKGAAALHFAPFLFLGLLGGLGVVHGANLLGARAAVEDGPLLIQRFTKKSDSQCCDLENMGHHEMVTIKTSLCRTA